MGVQEERGVLRAPPIQTVVARRRMTPLCVSIAGIPADTPIGVIRRRALQHSRRGSLRGPPSSGVSAEASAASVVARLRIPSAAARRWMTRGGARLQLHGGWECCSAGRRRPGRAVVADASWQRQKLAPQCLRCRRCHGGRRRRPARRLPAAAGRLLRLQATPAAGGLRVPASATAGAGADPPAAGCHGRGWLQRRTPRGRLPRSWLATGYGATTTTVAA